MSVATAEAPDPDRLRPARPAPMHEVGGNGPAGSAVDPGQALRWSMRGLPFRAQAYIAVMALGGLAAAIWVARYPVQGVAELGLAFALACAAAMAQAFEVHMPNNKAYNATLAFLLTA